MVYKQQGASPSVEVLFSVPKRNHKRANKRNLLRRRMKEAYRLQKVALWEYATNQGLEFDVALVYSSKELLSYKSIENGIRKVLEELCCVR
jgi:ribonuclease P protein component